MARSQSRGRDYSSGGGASRSSRSRSHSSSRSPDRSRRRSRSLSPRRDDHRGGGRVGGGGRGRSAEPRGSVGKRDGSRGRRNDSRDDRRGGDHVPGSGERGRGLDMSRRDRSRDRGRSRSIEQDHRRDGSGGGYRYRKTDKDRPRSSSSRKESARVESRDRSGFGDRERDRDIRDRDRDRSFRVDSRDRSHSRSRNKKHSSDGGNISRSAKRSAKSDRPKPSIALSGDRPPRPPPPAMKDARAHVAKRKPAGAEVENATAGSGATALNRSRPSASTAKPSSVERRANEDGSLSSGGSGPVSSGSTGGKSPPPSSRKSGGVNVASPGSRGKSLPPSSRHSGSPPTTTSPVAATAHLSVTAMISHKKQPSDTDSKAEASRRKSLPPSSRHSGSPSTTTSPDASTAPLSATAMISPKKQPSDPDSKAEASRKSSSTSALFSTTPQARRAPRKAAVVAAVKIKSTSEAGGGVSGLNETGDSLNSSSYGAESPAPDDSEEEATLDLEMPSAGALAPNSQTQASAVSTPKPIGPHEWVMAKLKVDEMITDDKFQVFTNPPRASIGRGKKYDAYLAMVSEPYWLSKIQKQIAKTKPACSYETVDEFLHDVRRLCANSFVFTRSTSNDLLLKFLRKLEAKEVKNVLTPSRPFVPKWQQCLALLDKLYSCGDSIYFMAYPFKVYFLSQPEEEFPDYAEKVKQAMDMAKVVIKLLTGRYKDEGGMVADLRLMIDNCRRYYTGNPNHEEKTIQLALSNAKIVEDALQAGLELLLPEWQATAALPQPGNKSRPKSVTPPPKPDRRASLSSGTASASRLAKPTSSQSGGNSSGNQSNSTTVAAASAALAAASSHTLVAGINAKTKQSGSMLGAGSKGKAVTGYKPATDSGDTRRAPPPMPAAAPSPAAAVGGSLAGTTSSKSASRPSKKVGGGDRKSPGKPGSTAGSGSGVLGTGGAAAGVGAARATMGPGSKTRVGEAARLPAEITGAAATVGAGISRPGVSLGAVGSRSVDGGGVPERNTWPGSNVAEAAKGLPLSETQAKNMGLVAIGSDGKARRKLVRDLKARCNKAIKRLQESTLPPKLAQLSLKIFDVPVDETKVTDYSQIVSHKMDVDTVKTKIKNSRYPHVAAFFSDLLLVYENAVNYYEKDGKLRDKLIYEAAKALHTLASHERTAMVREFVLQVGELRATVSSSASRPASDSTGSPTPSNNVGIVRSTSPSPLPSPSLSAFSAFSARGSRPQASAGIGAGGVGASAVEASGRMGVYGVKGKKSSAGETLTPEKPRSKSPVLPAGKTRPAEDSLQAPPRKKPRQDFTIPKKPEEIARLEAKKRAEEEQKIKAEKERADRVAKAKADADRKAVEEERMRLGKLRREKEAAEEAARKAREEALQKAKKKADRKAKEEAARKAKEEAARKAKEEAARKAKEEAALRKAKEESLRKAKEEAAAQKAREEAAAQKAREEAAAQKAREEAAMQKAKEEAAAQKAKEEAAAQKTKEEKAARKAEEKAARKAREEAARKAKEEKAARREAEAREKAEAKAKAEATKKETEVGRKAVAAARKAEEAARKTEARKQRQAEPRAKARAAAAKARIVMRFPTDIPTVTSAALESPGAQGLLNIFNDLAPLDDLDWKSIAPRLSMKTKAYPKTKSSRVKKPKSAPPVKLKAASPAKKKGASPWKVKGASPTKMKVSLPAKVKVAPTKKKKKRAIGASGELDGGSDAVIWSAASKSRPVSQFRSSTGPAAAGTFGAKKASPVPTKRPAITLPEPGAVELPEVESPEAGEVVLSKMAGGKASKGKRMTAGSKPKKGGGPKATSQSQESGAKDSTIRAKPSRVNDSADKPRLTLKFNAKLVRSVSAKSIPTPPVASSSSNPLLRQPLATTAAAASFSSPTWPAVKPETPSKPASKPATTTTPGSSKSTTLKPGSKSTARSTSRSGSKSTGKSSPKTLEPSLPPPSSPDLSLSLAPPPQSGKGVGRGKGTRGKNSKGNSSKTPPGNETPDVVMPPEEKKPLAPDGWGPLTTQKQDCDWQKAAITVLNRLKRRETLLNDEFLSRYPELDINVTKEFSLPPAEMAEYRALVGEPMVLSTVEHRVRNTHFFKCPQHFVNECLRIFTNGIVWWGQDRFKGDQFAGDVIMICKHLRSVFRWHCLETLPLWVWSGKDGKDPPPPDPVPSTEEEWEAEHLRPCPLTPAEQKRARLLREEQVSSMKMTEGRSLASYVLKQMKKKDTKAIYWAEVDLTLCPDYLEVCPHLMDLGTVERKLGRPDDSNREYLYHSEFIRDMRLIYANSIAYNNPDTVINELDRETTVKYNTLAKNHAAEFEKLLGSPYTINVLEELGRMKIVKIILDRREELRKIQFEETARKNREANREAELLRAEEEEAEEDRDPVERDEMARQESKKRRAVVKEKKMLKKLEEVERDNMCEAMRLMSEVHKSSIAAAMAETRSYGKRKEEWERKVMELEAAESAPQSVASKSCGLRELTSDSHWGTFALGSSSPETSCEKEAVASFGTADTAQSEAVVKEVRGSWAVLSSVEEPFEDGAVSHIGNGGSGSGIGSGSWSTCLLEKSKKPSSLGGVKFALKGKARLGQKGRARPMVAVTMAQAADVADAEEEAIEAAKAVVDAGEVPDSGGKEASAPEDAMKAAPAGIIDVAGEVAKGVFSGSSGPNSEGKRSRAVLFTHAPGVGSAPAVQSASVTVTNPVSRVQLTVSKPLLADNDTVAGRNLEWAIRRRRDALLGRMSWEGGLYMIRTTVKDASGGQRLPGIELILSPSRLKIKVVGTTITVASPPHMTFKDGFYAACSDDLVNGLRDLRYNLRKVDIQLDQHARAGQESLMRVENLQEKRLALSQVGEIMDEEDFQFIPALGGAWLGLSHTPKLKADSSVWWEGLENPFVNIRLLVRRARLFSVRVEEDTAYAEMAAASAAEAAAAEMAAASAAEVVEAANAPEASIAAGWQRKGRRRLRKLYTWGVEESREAARLFESLPRPPTARMFSPWDD